MSWCLAFLLDDLSDLVKNMIELLFCLAAAMAHRELRVHEFATDEDFESTPLRACVDGGGDLDFVAKVLFNKGGQCGCVAAVASPGSKVDGYSGAAR